MEHSYNGILFCHYNCALKTYLVPWREKEDIKLDHSVIFPVFQVPSWEEMLCPPQDP